jgi:hypothetical protein
MYYNTVILYIYFGFASGWNLTASIYQLIEYRSKDLESARILATREFSADIFINHLVLTQSHVSRLTEMQSLFFRLQVDSLLESLLFKS